jgi:hypothetical protein
MDEWMTRRNCHHVPRSRHVVSLVFTTIYFPFPPFFNPDSEESASASASADINTTSQKEVYFCAKGALDDLEDATQFAVAMTNRKYSN